MAKRDNKVRDSLDKKTKSIVFADDTVFNRSPAESKGDLTKIIVSQASSIDPDQEQRIFKQVPKFLTSSSLEADPNIEDIVQKKQEPDRSILDQLYTERSTAAGNASHSSLPPLFKAHALNAAHCLRLTQKTGLNALTTGKMSEYDLFLSQIAPNQGEYLRVLSLHGSMPKPFEDSLSQIKHESLREVQGFNLNKRRRREKVFKEKFEESKYLCNIAKRQEEIIEKYSISKTQEQDVIVPRLTYKSRRQHIIEDEPRKDEWYDWIDSFRKDSEQSQSVFSSPNRSSKSNMLSKTAR